MLRETLLAIALGSLVVGCAEPPNDSTRDVPTYFADVKPILDAHCVVCHDGGGIAPFELTTAADAQRAAGVMQAKVVAKEMPPWLPDDGCRSYENRRSLTEEEIQTIAAWADAGAPAGAPAMQPLSEEREEGLSRVDVALEMPSAYTQSTTPDELRCFAVDWPLERKTFVTGFDAAPGDPQVVHHMSFFVSSGEHRERVAALDAADPGPGFDCFSGPSVPHFEIGSWVPGMVGVDFPDRTGFEMEPGSQVIVQMHYNTDRAGRKPDRSRFLFRVDERIEHAARFKIVKDAAWQKSLEIPAYAPDTVVRSVIDVGGATTIRRVGLHQHYLGKSSSLDIVRADGTRECLLHIPKHNFHWQAGYVLTEPAVLGKDDRLELACHWDNTPEHQRVVGGRAATPVDTRWGMNAGEEMCLGALLLTED